MSSCHSISSASSGELSTSSFDGSNFSLPSGDGLGTSNGSYSLPSSNSSASSEVGFVFSNEGNSSAHSGGEISTSLFDGSHLSLPSGDGSGLSDGSMSSDGSSTFSNVGSASSHGGKDSSSVSSGTFDS